ncbi:RHS repeat-associated core domain-containing protein, partial [Corallococcus exiguus]|uniref:RHS repeat-associated core domain-containing protein n=1 Tax=Corallococcus exiguus TaxID=83462 RepID=UPI0015612230
IRFQGQQLDPETGLHYNRFRYYDPTLGQYATQDPLGLMGGFNKLIYSGANPVINIDPKGLDFKDKATKGGEAGYEAYDAKGTYDSGSKRACLIRQITNRQIAYQELLGKLGSGKPMSSWENEALRYLNQQHPRD